MSAVAGCTTSSIDDFAPASATQPLAAPTAAVAPDTNAFPPAPGQAAVTAQTVPPAQNSVVAARDSSGPVDIGQYPNLNIPPQTAAAQLTDAEIKAKRAALKARGQAANARNPGGASVDAVRLKKLAQTHADEALREIESE